MEYALHEIVDMTALGKLLDGFCLIGVPACFVAGGDGEIAAQAGPRLGEIGDRKIFAMNLEDAIRIRTGERSEAAL